MSKYIKLEDAIKKVEEHILPDFRGKARTMLSDIPTIEVCDDCSDYYKGYCARYEDGCLHQCKDAPSEDCISREYILGEAFMSGEYNGETKSFDLPVVSVRDIEDAPSVVPTTEQSSIVGEWIDNHNGTFTCSKCGDKHSKSNYCSACGARMKGLRNENYI